MTKTADERAKDLYQRVSELEPAKYNPKTLGVITDALTEYGKQEREAGRQDGLKAAADEFVEDMDTVFYGDQVMSRLKALLDGGAE